MRSSKLDNHRFLFKLWESTLGNCDTVPRTPFMSSCVPMKYWNTWQQRHKGLLSSCHNWSGWRREARKMGRVMREKWEKQREWVAFKSLHFKWMVGADWWIAWWALSSTWISHAIHLYANRTAVVQPQYQQKPLWCCRQTFVSLLCCQRHDNEATGTNPATPRLSCSLKTSLITTSCKRSHLVKCLSQPITTKSIASVITLIWGQHELLVYLLTYSRHWGTVVIFSAGKAREHMSIIKVKLALAFHTHLNGKEVMWDIVFSR